MDFKKNYWIHHTHKTCILENAFLAYCRENALSPLLVNPTICCSLLQVVTHRVHSLNVPLLRPIPNNTMDNNQQDERRTFSAIQPQPLRVTRSDLQLNTAQTAYASNLQPILEILTQHQRVWFARPPSATSRSLSSALALVNGLYLTIASLGDESQMAVSLGNALRGKTFSNVIKCIRCFRGANTADREIVVQHRYAVQNYLYAFFDSIIPLFERFPDENDASSVHQITEFINTTKQEIERVNANDALEGEHDVSQPPPAMYQ